MIAFVDKDNRCDEPEVDVAENVSRETFVIYCTYFDSVAFKNGQKQHKRIVLRL